MVVAVPRAVLDNDILLRVRPDGSAETSCGEDHPFEWRRFPVGHARIRANRRLDWRRAALFVFWYIFVLLPGLALVYSTVLIGTVLGFALLAVVPPVGAFLTALIAGITGTWRVTFNKATALDGHYLYTKYGPNPPTAKDLHSGVTSVLGPNWRRGRAWVLAVHTSPRRKAVPWMLLSDPCTGELRNLADLRQLADVLAASPMERDQISGRAVLDLVQQGDIETGPSACGPLWEEDDLPTTTWSTFKSLVRTLPLLAVVVTFFLVAGMTVTKGEELSAGAITDWSAGVLMYTGVVLLTILSLYLLGRLVHVVWTVVDTFRRTRPAQGRQVLGLPRPRRRRRRPGVRRDRR